MSMMVPRYVIRSTIAAQSRGFVKVFVQPEKASLDAAAIEFHVRGETAIRAFVRTSDSAQTEDGHLDEYSMGVITGYCKTGSEAGEGFCPHWVNETLG